MDDSSGWLHAVNKSQAGSVQDLRPPSFGPLQSEPSQLHVPDVPLLAAEDAKMEKRLARSKSRPGTNRLSGVLLA